MKLLGPGLLAVATSIALSGCGGDGANGDAGSTSSSWTAGTYQPASTFAAQCATPRTGNDPTNNRPYPDKAGSKTTENNWLRSWSHDFYLWYRELPDRDPAASSTADYFALLKTTATTPSGNPKDKFHFTYPTTQWVALSQSGVEAGYGAQWVLIASRPPRQVVIAYTEPGSPAADANLARGGQVLAVDGVDMVNANDTAGVNILNEGLYPSAAGASHSFSILDLGASTPRTVTLVSANVTSTPVQNVGYHRDALGPRRLHALQRPHRDLRAAPDRRFHPAPGRVSDLVLDIRYNGGGYLDIASEVAYMIAGPGPTTGKAFERTVFNDKYTTNDPVTGRAPHAGALSCHRPRLLRDRGAGLAEPRPAAGLRAHEPEHLLGERGHRQRAARGRRRA